MKWTEHISAALHRSDSAHLVDSILIDTVVEHRFPFPIVYFPAVRNGHMRYEAVET